MDEDTSDADRDPRRLGVATQERVRLAVHERVFGDARDPVKIGRYTVLKRIGTGGMGVVYAAYDTELDRKVALKLLHAEGAGHGERLTREAKALAKLSHPSIVAVHEVGVHDGNVFVAMEFVDGETLREHVTRHTLEWREIVALYLQAGRGLAAAHAAGLVHRDFKPDNALVGASDAGARVRVLDFGLARDVGDREGSRPLGIEGAIDRAVELTQTGTLLGTPAYMAPEQYVGTAVDAHADQFAFCVSLWEALYRERPFDDTSVANVAAAILAGRRRPPPAATRVPSALQRLLERGLELRTVDRFSSMVELVDTLEAIADLRRRGRLALAIVAGIAAFGIGATVWIGRERDHSTRADALAGEAAVEHARAEQALRELADREQAVLLAEAKILLERDPTTAIAKLAQLDPDARQWGTVARILAADARDRGVARRVQRLPAGREAHRWWPSGSRWVVIGEPTRDGELLLDPEHGTLIPLPSGRELVLDGGAVLLGSKQGLWLIPNDASPTRRLDDTAFSSDYTTHVRASSNRRFVALIGELGDRGAVRVHDLVGGTIRVERFKNGTEILALSDDGRRMVVYEDGHLFVHGGAREQTLVRGQNVTARAVADDFATIAFGIQDGEGRDVLVVADVTGRERFRIVAPGLAANDVAFAPGGRQFALKRRGGGLDLVELADGRMRHLPTDGEIDRVRFSAGGGHVLVADERHAIQVWRPVDGGLRTIHAGIELIDFALDEASGQLRVLGRDQQREYHDVLPEPRRTISTLGTMSIAADPAGRTVVAAGAREDTLVIYRDELPPRTIDTPDGIGAIAVSPDGERFATAGGPRLSLYARNGELLAEVDDPDAPMRLAWDPTGARLAWVGHSGTVVVWHPDHGEPRLYEPTRLGPYSLAFVPNSDRIGVVGWDHLGPLFYLLDPQRGVLATIPMAVDDDTQPRALAFSSRGQLAFAAVGEGVFVVDARGGTPRRIGGRDVADASLWFSPDGGQLAAVGGRSGATVWDVESGASYHPALAGVQPREGFGTIGADGPFVLVGNEVVTRTVLGLGGDADDVRAWVAGATDLHVDPGPLAFLAD